jgi:cellobiose-specific phosphotransferase system component IIA
MLKNPAYAGAFVYGRTRTIRTGLAPHQAKLKRLPIEEWKIRVNDKYPAYISWSTYEEIQAQLQDNYAEYDRNKTRGIPRPGAALLHGLVYCGECGHKMVVQYKGSTRYICNYLRQQYQVPVCQYIPADGVDQYVVSAFFDALSAVELDAYTKAVKTIQQSDATIRRAHQQQLERLRYQAALAERQFNQVDPDNRLVAAELERRWEKALRELKQVELSQVQRQTPDKATLLDPELKTALMTMGEKLPQIWSKDVLTQVQRKALLRCLIDKVVIHRLQRDQVRIRIIWKGGDNTNFDLPIRVGSLAELTNGEELEARIVALARLGFNDDDVAAQLTAEGFRSPMRLTLLPSTVKRIRLEHRIFQQRSQSHPRQIEGYLTVSQLALMLNFSKHWFYDRIHNETIAIARDAKTQLYLFPDEPNTLTKLQRLHAGQIQHLRFS